MQTYSKNFSAKNSPLSNQNLTPIPSEFLYRHVKNSNKFMCLVCPKACILEKNETGYCGIRTSDGEQIYSKTYGLTTGMSVDPVEKKPLYHFLPGTDTLSLGGIGCNFSCIFCQNYFISQKRDEQSIHSMDLADPEMLVKMALEEHLPSISLTYNEPTINIEYVVAVSILAHEHGLKVIVVTNGFLREQTAKLLAKYLDAANVDFKGDKDFYRKICDARQTPVKKTIEEWVDDGVHVEITTLLIPTLNDSAEFITGTADWINKRLGPETVLHFSRFFPMYKLNHLPPTPLKTLIKAKQLAHSQGLKYVYIGNVGSEINEDNTFCSECGKMLIARGTSANYKRLGYTTHFVNYDPKTNSCTSCHTQAPFVI